MARRPDILLTAFVEILDAQRNATHGHMIPMNTSSRFYFTHMTGKEEETGLMVTPRTDATYDVEVFVGTAVTSIPCERYYQNTSADASRIRCDYIALIRDNR